MSAPMNDCPHLIESLSDPLSAEARAHLETCPVCGPARRAFDAGAADAPDQTLENIRTAVSAEVAQVPRRWWVDALALVGINLVIATAAFGGLKLSHTQHDGELLRWAVAVGLGLVGALGTFAAVVPGKIAWRWAGLVVALGSAALGLLAANGYDPGVPFMKGTGCGLTELLIGLLPFVAAVVATTKSTPDPLRAAFAGWVGGSVGLLVLHFHCAIGSLTHIAVWHVGTFLLFGLFALGLRRLLPTRTYAP